MSVAMAEKCGSGETLGKGISHHVVSGTVDDLDNAVGEIFHPHGLSHSTFGSEIPIVVFFANLVCVEPDSSEHFCERLC